MNAVTLKLVRSFLARHTDEELLTILRETAPLLSHHRLAQALQVLQAEQQTRSQRSASMLTHTADTQGSWLP